MSISVRNYYFYYAPTPPLALKRYIELFSSADSKRAALDLESQGYTVEHSPLGEKHLFIVSGTELGRSIIVEASESSENVSFYFETDGRLVSFLHVYGFKAYSLNPLKATTESLRLSPAGFPAYPPDSDKAIYFKLLGNDMVDTTQPPMTTDTVPALSFTGTDEIQPVNLFNVRCHTLVTLFAAKTKLIALNEADFPKTDEYWPHRYDEPTVSQIEGPMGELLQAIMNARHGLDKHIGEVHDYLKTVGAFKFVVFTEKAVTIHVYILKENA